MANFCAITGSLVDGSLNPILGAAIYASPVVDSNIIYNTSTGYYKGLVSFPVRALSDVTGVFSINLVKNALFRIVIRYIGFDEVVLVPTTDTAVLWSLVGSHTTTIPTSTGNVVVDGGGGAAW